MSENLSQPDPTLALNPLLQHHKIKIIPHGLPEALIFIGEGRGLARVAIAPPSIPGDEFFALSNHRHSDATEAPLAFDMRLCNFQGFAPQAAALRGGADGDGADIAIVRMPFEGDTAQRPGVIRPHQHDVGIIRDLAGEHPGIDPLAAKQMRFGRPARFARVATVSRLDQPNQW